jgi:proteasome accessory factor C
VARPGAEDRLRRILAVVPWVAAQDGPPLAEVCTRFGYAGESDLEKDLNLLFLCGVPPYTPDALIEVDIADGRVWIRYADYFDRPLRFTPAEALSLVTASAALVGDDADGALASGLAKLAGALGLSSDVVDVSLGAPPADHLGRLQEASRTAHQVEIDYYVYGRDEHTTRVVDPAAVYGAAGQWYVAGYCHLAAAERLFRVDRIARVEILDSTFDAAGSGIPPATFEVDASGDVVVLDVGPDAAWVVTQYPNLGATDAGNGWTRLTLPVSGEAWLARLLLRLGPDARVVRGDASLAARAAGRILLRYGRAAADDPGTTR